ncbi:MAG TPA: BamA/TamA family outer membrane protein [Haliangiales bacterium]|nr:BamA/TamA family outer membrane protein [Haliangiales bacterium]
MRALAALLVVTTVPVSLAAQPVEPVQPVQDDPTFGPLIEIERIDVVGASTNVEIIRREILVKPGDRLRSGDPRFNRSRFRVLALGYFTDVKLRQDKGSQPGAVVLVVEVVERGTFTLNRIFLGTSDDTPIWAGLDVGDTNVFGSGLGVAVGGVWAQKSSDVPGSRTQGALRLRVADERVLGSDFGVHATALYTVASEPLVAAGGARSVLNYKRAGGTFGTTWDFAPLMRVGADVRLESATAPDDAATADLRLRPGQSLVSTVTVGFERDTRPDPILPYRGSRFAFALESGFGDYEFAKAVLSFGAWRLLTERHVLGFRLGAGIILGRSPRFDQFYVGDVNPLQPPRPLDLAVSTRGSFDVFSTGADKVVTGDVYGGVSIEYAFQLFRNPRTIYGGDLFVSVGTYGLGSRVPFSAPVDLTFNVGLRLDTFIGVFELSLGNALGRLPL